MNLTTAIEQFCVEQICRGNSERTVQDYRQKLGRFLLFLGDRDVKQIDLPDLRSWYLSIAQSRIKSVSVQSYARSIRAFFHWLYLEGLIDVDLTVKFRLPKAKRDHIDVLTDEEILRIYSLWPVPGSWLDARNRVIVSLMLDCGLRLNEVVTAQRAHLHLRERYLIVDGKGAKQRAVAFGNETQRLLSDYLERAPVFERLIISGSSIYHHSDPVQGISQETIKDLIRKIRTKTGIKRLHAHLFRHSFATRYLENGGNIYSLQMLLGHTSLKMVQRYLHLCTKKIRLDFINYSPLDRLEDDKKATPEGGGKEWCTSRDSNPGPTD